MANSRMRSPLGRAIGLGSAKQGVEHWWGQRLTAVALIPLALWFVAALIAHIGADYAAFRHWAGEPITAILLILTLIATFYHLSLGLQVVIEDYVHTEMAKFGLIVLLRLYCVVFAVAGIFAVLKMAFAGAP